MGTSPNGVLGRRTNLPTWAVGALVALNILLVLACVLALRQNIEIRGFANQYMLLLGPTRGSIAPALTGEDADGRTQTISYTSETRPTLIYTFSKDCPHCLQNWQSMRSLQAVEPSRLRVVYVDTADKLTPDYLHDNGMEGSILLHRLDPQSALAYQARLVPQLELLDQSGRVLWSKIGELASADVAHVESIVHSK